MFAEQINAQNNPVFAYNPDYVVFETRLFEKRDTAYTFLFEPNEESFNKKPFTWQFMDIRFDRKLAYDYHEIDRKDKKRILRPINYNRVDKILVRYAVFYKNNKVVYFQPAELVLMEYIDYLENEDPAYIEVFSVSDQKSLLMYWLDAKFIPGADALTYWEFFNQSFELAPLQFTSYSSLDYAEKITDKKFWEGFTAKNPPFDFPRKLSDEAEIEIKILVPNIDDSVLYNGLSKNALPKEFLDFSFAEKKNIPLFFPFENLSGYKNLSHLICSSVSQEDIAFYSFSKSEFFKQRLLPNRVREMIDGADALHRIDLDIPDGINKEKTFLVFSGFYFLVLKNDGVSYPIALAPIIKNGDNALFWILFNEAFQNTLFKYEAFIPGKSAVSFGDYFKNSMYNSDIVSTRCIKQVEWKEIYLKLK